MKPFEVIVWNVLSESEQKCVLLRPALQTRQELTAGVASIVDDVRVRGDQALRALTQKYDDVSLDSIKVSEAEFQIAKQKVKPEVLSALMRAVSQIKKFHVAQMPEATQVQTSPGIVCERRYQPIQRVGLYIPGGTAPLPSTVLMLGMPSKLAGASKRIICTPPRGDGTIDPHILVAAELCGIQDVYKLGGAQAIAAMAYGTETVPKVDKIFGPGNAWVTEAKGVVSRDPAGAAIDMPAGPSELLVIADRFANPAFVASDLLSQAEHGADSQVIFITTDERLMAEVLQAIHVQWEKLPRRGIAEASLRHARFILSASFDEAIDISNQYAPEHLILNIKEMESNLKDRIQNAGSVFLGPWSPEAVGDYASGTNHVLPTYGYARSMGGVSLESFLKPITFQRLTPEGLKDIGPTVEILAGVEGLEAHKNAVTIRLQALGEREYE